MSVNKNRFPLMETAEEAEKAILVGVDLPGSSWSWDETLAELERLAWTAGAETVAVTTQKLSTPNPRTFVGSGKAEEIAQLCREFHADLVVFDDELSPSQQSNIEKIVPKSVKVIDRTALILDIFALHATTKEGRLQVRLAQNHYLLPRLRGMWSHLASNRMGGGVGSRFGEGESQLEVDRRLVRKRISRIRNELKDVAQSRATQRKSRKDGSIFRIALAGYTNAGKSSLMNRLTGAQVLAYDKLFATLDSTTRRLELDAGPCVTLTDTVGFIQKLPTSLVESFHSTLEEIREADLILLVVDTSSPQRDQQVKAVREVLGQIDAAKIETVLVYNKIDLCGEGELAHLAQLEPEAAFVSAVTGEGSQELLERITQAVLARDPLVEVLIPYAQGRFVQMAHERAHVEHEEYREDGTFMRLRIPAPVLPSFAPFATGKDALAYAHVGKSDEELDEMAGI